METQNKNSLNIKKTAKKKEQPKHPSTKEKSTTRIVIKSIGWFLIGVFLGSFLLGSFAFILFQQYYQRRIYPGIIVDGQQLGGKTPAEVKQLFDQKNQRIKDVTFFFQKDQYVATISAQQLQFGYDSNLIANQAYSMGRSQDLFTNMNLILQSYLKGISLPPAYRYSEDTFDATIQPLVQSLTVPAVEALFNFENGKVVEFRPSSVGQEVDKNRLKADFLSRAKMLFDTNIKTVKIAIPVLVIKPKLTTEKVNTIGIKELIASGTSLFGGSIPNRIHNIALASSRVNGILVAPGEIFSFNNALGDVSVFTGYKQAYVIENSRTVLGDGGGVCQVSTTLFRAILNAGLSVVERHAHAYRVHYYEEDSPPGIDATVYTPTVDLRFKNDTSHYLLVQSIIDFDQLRLTYNIYGTKDDRQVEISAPLVSSQTPPPDPLYQDDPTLAKGEIKQVDFAAWGANVSFTRTVKKNGQVIISETYVSNFKPWQAVYTRGTKEG